MVAELPGSAYDGTHLSVATSTCTVSRNLETAHGFRDTYVPTELPWADCATPNAFEAARRSSSGAVRHEEPAVQLRSVLSTVVCCDGEGGAVAGTGLPDYVACGIRVVQGLVCKQLARHRVGSRDLGQDRGKLLSY